MGSPSHSYPKAGWVEIHSEAMLYYPGAIPAGIRDRHCQRCGNKSKNQVDTIVYPLVSSAVPLYEGIRFKRQAHEASCFNQHAVELDFPRITCSRPYQTCSP